MRRPAAPRLRDVGEHRWIARLRRGLHPGPGVVVGPGDDAAVIQPPRRPLLLTTDTLVEGVHFARGWEPPAALGRRALRVNLSDVAAMGGRPLAALVALQAPPRLEAAVLAGIMRGLVADARRWGVEVVGGNLAAAPVLAITVALVGEVGGRPLTRGGARAGEDVWVTGRLGGAAAALRALLAGRRARRPAVPVRLGVARRLAPLAHAAIDLSDGLVQDLTHVCRASGVGAELDAGALPLAPACRREFGSRAVGAAATGGEEYELLVVAPVDVRGRFARLAPRLGCPLTRVGRMVAGRPVVRVRDARGRAIALGRGGFDHFR